eukprot:6462576-Amphidinium_carterae.1
MDRRRTSARNVLAITPQALAAAGHAHRPCRRAGARPGLLQTELHLRGHHPLFAGGRHGPPKRMRFP